MFRVVVVIVAIVFGVPAHAALWRPWRPPAIAAPMGNASVGVGLARGVCGCPPPGACTPERVRPGSRKGGEGPLQGPRVARAMNCGHCGTPINEGYTTCPACGGGLSKATGLLAQFVRFMGGAFVVVRPYWDGWRVERT